MIGRIQQFHFAVYRAADVRARLDFPGCIDAVRRAMAALSRDVREQPLRTINPIREGRLFAVMPGMAAGEPGFGAKLISVFRDPNKGGRAAHRGVVVLFEEDTGSVVCVADAHEVTRIRTACASAVANAWRRSAHPHGVRLRHAGGGTYPRHALVRAIRRVRGVSNPQIAGTLRACGRNRLTAAGRS
jgi:ornithine cyclodeaminase